MIKKAHLILSDTICNYTRPSNSLSVHKFRGYSSSTINAIEHKLLLIQGGMYLGSQAFWLVDYRTRHYKILLH